MTLSHAKEQLSYFTLHRGKPLIGRDAVGSACWWPWGNQEEALSSQLLLLLLSVVCVLCVCGCVLSVSQFFFSFPFFYSIYGCSCFVAVSRLSSQVVRINRGMHYNILFYNLLIAPCCQSQISRCCCSRGKCTHVRVRSVVARSLRGSKWDPLAKSFVLYENSSQ